MKTKIQKLREMCDNGGITKKVYNKESQTYDVLFEPDQNFLSEVIIARNVVYKYAVFLENFSKLLDALEKADEALKNIYKNAGPSFDPEMDQDANIARQARKEISDIMEGVEV